MKGKRFLSLLLCLVMVLGLLPTSVFADSESSLGENDVYKLQILTYSEKNGKVVPTTQLMDRARSSVTLKRWDTNTNRIKEEKLPLTGYNGTATGKVMKDPNYTVSMTIYPAAGYKFADTNSVRLYIGAGATFNATNCCNYETNVNSDGSRTYTFKYTEEIGKAVATVKNGALFFLFSFEEGSSTPTLTANDTYNLSIVDAAVLASEDEDFTGYMDMKKSMVTVSYWDSKQGKPAEKSLSAAVLADDANTWLMKDTTYEVKVHVYPIAGYTFADSNEVTTKIMDSKAYDLHDYNGLTFTYEQQADGSRIYKYKYTAELGKAIDAQGTRADGACLYLVFSFVKGSSTPTLTANDTYNLSIVDAAVLASEDEDFTGYMDMKKSMVTVSYWDSKQGKPAEKSLSAAVLADDANTWLMKDTTYEVKVHVYPIAGYTFADSNEVTTKIMDSKAYDLHDYNGLTFTYEQQADGSRIYKYKYTAELGKAIDAQGTRADGACLYLVFSFVKGSSTPTLTANDTYNLSIVDAAVLASEDEDFTGYMDMKKSMVTVSYWDSKQGKPAEKSLSAAVLADDANTWLMKDTTYEVKVHVYPIAGYTFADSNEVTTKIMDSKAYDLHDYNGLTITYDQQGDGSRIYKYKYTADLGRAIDAQGRREDGACLYLVFSFKKAEQCVVEYFPITGNYKRSVKLNVTAGTRAPLLTQAQLDKVDSDTVYFSKVTIPAWRSEMPTKTTTDYIYNGERYTDAESMPVINGYTKLYAENTIEPGTLIPAEYRFHNLKKPVQAKWMYNAETWRYNVKQNRAEETLQTEQNQVTFEIPVGQPIGENRMLQFTKYSELKATNGALTVPKYDAVISKWTYQENTDTYLPFTKDTVIPVYRALRSLQQGYRILYLTANVTYSCELTFDTNRADLTIDPYRYEVTTTSKDSTPAAKLTTEKINEINDKIATVTDQVFEGWYLKDNFALDSKVDITSSKFYLYSDVDLYAKWVNPNTITYDLTYNGEDVTVENAAAYKPYIVGAGAYLTEPARPVATGSQAGKLAFMGWYTDEARQTPWNFKQNAVNTSTTLYAKWVEATPLTIQFKKYDPDDLGKLEGVRSVTVPVAAGYTFGTLPDLPNSTEGEYVVGQDRDIKYTDWMFIAADKPNTLTTSTDLSKFGLNLNEPLVVYTAYDTRFTFTFDTGEGGPTPEPQVITSEDGKASAKAKKPETDPSRAGYDFGGWYKDAAGNTEFKFAGENGAEEYDKNTTIYAKWVSQPEYTRTFDLTATPGATVVLKLDGKTISQDSSSTATAVTYKLQRGTYTYTCSAKNYLSQTGTLTIDALSDKEITIPVKLVAFVPVTKVSLKTNQVMKNKAHNLDTLAVITPDNATSRTITWALAGTYSGVTLDDNLLKIDAGCAETQVTLTATVEGGKLSEDGTSQEAFVQENIKLSIIPYVPTISFRNGKTAPSVLTKPLPEDMQTNSDGKLTLTTNNPEATGYDFAGWYLDEDCTEAQKWDAAHVFETDSILYAKWVKKTVEITVTFSDGGSQTKTETHNAGETLILPPIMFTKAGHIFAAWELPNKTTQTAGSSIAALPENDVTYTATWTAIGNSITKGDIENSILGITDKNAADHKQQLIAARDALMTGTATKTDAALINKLSNLFVKAGLGSVTIAGDAKQGVSEVGAILSSDGAKVILNVNKQATPGKTLPEAYQNAEYKSAWYSLSMTVGGATTDPKVPVILSLPIPTELSGMAADTIRVLAYKGAATEPVVMTPTVSDGKLTFGFDGNGQLAFVGKSISDAADTRVTALEMRYNGTKMGNVEQDANGNFTVTLPSTTSESVLQDLASGINSKWVTYMTVAPKATVKPSDGGAQNAEYWAKTGLTLTYSLTNSNKYSDSKTFTVTAENGTTRNFTVTVKKITDADRNYKIAVSNINGGTVTATPNPAAAGEEVKLTVTPNDGKKLVAGSLSYCLQSAGAKSVPIDESSLMFIMPAGDININAQFEDDASAPIKNPPQITAFMINGVSAVINSDTKAITIILPYGTDLRHVAPTIVTANASKVKPSSAQRVDLSTPKAYRVYASNGAYVTYTVTAYTEEPSPTQSLWEKLQNQINSSPNWWELAEYQKKAGYYR